MESVILQSLKKYGIKQATVNILNLIRYYLVTKETMKDICNNKSKRDKLDLVIPKESINDDLEELIVNLRNQNLQSESKLLYFLPKLSDTEQKYWLEDSDHLDEYKAFRIHQQDPDVPKEEMDRSDSKAKYCYSVGCKTTFYEDYEKVESEQFILASDAMANPLFEPMEDFETEYFAIRRKKQPFVNNSDEFKL